MSNQQNTQPQSQEKKRIVRAAYLHSPINHAGIGSETSLVKEKIPSISMYLEGGWLLYTAKLDNGKPAAGAVPAANIKNVIFE